MLTGDRGGFDPSRSTKSPHHSRTGDPAIIQSPRNSRQGAGYVLSKMSAANNNNKRCLGSSLGAWGEEEEQQQLIVEQGGSDAGIRRGCCSRRYKSHGYRLTSRRVIVITSEEVLFPRWHRLRGHKAILGNFMITNVVILPSNKYIQKRKV